MLSNRFHVRLAGLVQDQIVPKRCITAQHRIKVLGDATAERAGIGYIIRRSQLLSQALFDDEATLKRESGEKRIEVEALTDP